MVAPQNTLLEHKEIGAGTALDTAAPLLSFNLLDDVPSREEKGKESNPEFEILACSVWMVSRTEPRAKCVLLTSKD